MISWPTSAALIALASLGAYAQSQTVSSLNPGATQDQINAAIVAATPAPCTAPLPDTLTGSAGVGEPCMARPDSTRPALVQAITVVTASDGTFTGSWPAAFPASPTARLASIDVDRTSNNPFTCAFFVGEVTATNFSGKCWQIVPTTLSSTVSGIVGLTISPLVNSAGGQTVRVQGRR